jgi:hypothetical protein
MRRAGAPQVLNTVAKGHPEVREGRTLDHEPRRRPGYASQNPLGRATIVADEPAIPRPKRVRAYNRTPLLWPSTLYPRLLPSPPWVTIPTNSSAEQQPPPTNSQCRSRNCVDFDPALNVRLSIPDSRFPTPDSRLPTPDSRLPTPPKPKWIRSHPALDTKPSTLDLPPPRRGQLRKPRASRERVQRAPAPPWVPIPNNPSAERPAPPTNHRRPKPQRGVSQ